MNKKHFIGKKNINIIFIETVMGVILIAIVASFAIRTDIISAQKNLSYAAGHINDQCNNVTRINLAAETKSLMRVIESAQQVKQNIVYEKRIKENTDYIFSQEFLKKNTEECYLSAVILLDNNGKPVAQYYKDDMETVELDEYSSSLLDVADNALKSFATRIDLEDGSYIDMAAKGMADGTGIVITCYHTSTEYADDYNLSFDHILSGYYDSEGGTVVVTSGDKIISSSNEDMIGNSVDDYIILKKIKDSDESGKLMHAQSSKSPYNHDFGLMKRGRNYYVYIYLPERAIFDNTISHIIYTFAIFMYIIVIYNMLRWKTAQIYEKNQSELSQQYASELAKKNEQLKEAISREEQANAAKSDFLSRMTHDIRTPLNGIIGLLKIDEKHMTDTALVNENRKKMEVAANHLLSLINDVLQMSKLEDGDIELANEVVDLNQLAVDVITIVEQRAADAGVTLEYDRPSENMFYPYVYGSPLHLRQIFLNIYGNCIKYNKVGGYVRTDFSCVYKTSDKVLYEWTISDNGVGMNEEFLKHIFEPFAQEKSDARSIYQGTGLGMAIVKRLIDKMDGTVKTISKKDEGTTFVIRIPFKTADVQDVKNNTSEELITHKKSEKEYMTGYAQKNTGEALDITGVRLLLAEDNKLNQEIIETFLRDEGALVKIVSDGQQAVEEFGRCKEGTYDAILMDVMMPKLDGMTATRLIRAMDREDARVIPIIAMTANAFEEDARKCIAAGMNVHMAKPLDLDEVIEVIARLCS
uniref:hybrid sensor histidine kinase/response regulator n=1 Tax=Lachnospira sp. TaxID=2049031 RepID=UPI003FEE2C91